MAESELPRLRLRPARRSIFQEADVDTIIPRSELEARTSFSSLSSVDSERPTLSRTSSEYSQCDLSISTDRSRSTMFYLPSRLMMLACALLVTLSLTFETPFLAKAGPSVIGARAGVLRTSNLQRKSWEDGQLVARADTDTDICSRWSQQSAIINGTIYIYGGRATTQQGQTDNTWVNDFFTIDVTKPWDISSPAVKGLPQPSGPPAVSNGYLWSSYDQLHLYGGEYSDTPTKTPDDFSLWTYDIKSASWTEQQNPQTSKGNNSASENQPVQRSAEGAGISVAELGRGWYFAGHVDSYTTPGWSNQVERVYLKSLIEYTFPGHTNDGLQSLGGGKTAGPNGIWRNITEGGIQDTAQFPIRADSAIVYVPGYGAQGILVNMGGGTNVSFSQMNVIDVFDIATSTWYKQSTAGQYPTLRVNPCAVAASAPDGTSTNIYMYGGQNLVPYKNQTQFGDIWILTIPGFTWIEVDTTGQSVPPARVGHTCNMWDGQMIVVGGYNTDLAGGCDSGFYVFSATNLTWQNNFNSLGGGNTGNNTQNKQSVQASDPAALTGSYGYQVPDAVQKVIGGKGYGGATITAPAQLATAGPIATGKPITYTVTGANGAVITATGTAEAGAQNSHSGPNVGAIVAGVVAGCFAVLAAYLGFCAWLYRRQLTLYKNHVAMTQRAAAAGGPGEKSAFLGSSTENSSLGKPVGTSEYSSGAAATAGSGSGYESSVPQTPGVPLGRDSTANSSTENLVGEPTFFGVLLNPRRSLRVVNRD
ncbi:uncharacterized protein KY384_006052 [Bacidia gigantensis]|uniref:uncharacterized protein n=1 Tax=Bacidia gigantensis TaxID=2732470 RepID=UPI001D044E66|nr:uncharacterized protein KY384_006052 [Bacidia gigantensis]KAG8529415.1 hypothetical protein KY384_006052 [Bacidia gigantensis]